MEDTWKKLVDYLKPMPPGLIKETDELEILVWHCWHEFEVNDQKKIERLKFPHKMRQVYWGPPILDFTIKTHGPYVDGSIWEVIQDWKLNVETKVAICEEHPRREAWPRSQWTHGATRSKMESMAKKVVQLILDHEEEDKRVKWNRDGTVLVRIGKIIPAGAKSTTAVHRKKFRAELEGLLANKGWREVCPNVYAPQKVSNGKS